jgi:hypothetical protein
MAKVLFSPDYTKDHAYFKRRMQGEKSAGRLDVNVVGQRHTVKK